MSKTKGLRKGTFWVYTKQAGQKVMEMRSGYLYETDGITFGLTKTGEKHVTASHVLTGYRVLDGVTYAGTAAKLEELPMSQKALIYRLVAEMNDRTGFDELEPGIRTLGGDKALKEVETAQTRRPRA